MGRQIRGTTGLSKGQNMGHEQGQPRGQKSVNRGVKNASGRPKGGSKVSTRPPADPPGELLLRLSSLACFPPLMEKAETGEDPQDAGVIEHTGEALRNLLAALQHVQAVTSSPGGSAVPGFADATTMIQGAIALLAQREDPPRQRRAPLDQKQFRSLAQLVRQRRTEALLSRADLARLSGISPSTIRGLEAMRNNPGRATLCRLLAVPELKLEVSALTPDVQADPAWAPNSCFESRYDAARLFEEMVDLVNSPGGSFEQTYLYLDGQSANDWYRLSNHAPFVHSFRSSAPLEEVARKMARELAGATIDVAGLGSGDGKSEVRLARALAEASAKRRPEIKLYLLDISHTLLSAAYNYAAEALQPVGVAVRTIHANFHDLSRLAVLHGSPASRRVYAMLGGTIANLENEVRFFRDLAGWASKGDFLMVDCQMVVAPSNRPDLVRAADPPLRDGPSVTHLEWLTGPIRRHCRNLSDVKLSMELTTACPVPGSYELDCMADVSLRNGERRRFLIWRGKRYDPQSLADCLRGLGWEPVQTLGYGPGKEKTAALLLLRRSG